jgi:plasmid rolling circle replication initiator protein Rep
MKLTGALTPVGRVYQSGHFDANCINDASDDSLTAYSPKDQPWDTHKSHADDVATIYRLDQAYHRLSERINGCSGQLLFAWNTNTTTGESTLKLRGARFCRVRNCPVCQWRRSMLWRARFFQALPEIQAKHSTARWIFLTLTIRNCPITDLRDTLAAMNTGWQRLLKRPEFKSITGWIRTTEVTKGADGSAHPHFHCLLMTAPSYFNGKNYVTQARWRELWQSVMRLDYPPIIDVRTVKGNGDIKKAVCETLKYSVKPTDMTDDPAWFIEYTRQTHKLRFVATGGILKKILKTEKPETNEDLLLTDNPADTELDMEEILIFDWNKPTRKYRRKRE